MKRISLLLTLFSCISITLAQGRIDGFYLGKGNATAVLGAGFEDPNAYFAGTDKLDLERDVYYISLYLAYGISDKLEASISLPYIISNDNKNLQDLSLFLKYQFFEKQFGEGTFQLSAAGGFSTPVSNYTIGSLNDIGQQATIIESRLLVHYKNNNGWFGTLQSGYSFKLKEVPDSFPVILKLGKAAAQWYFDVYYDFQHAFGGIDYLGTPRPQNFKEFGVDYHKVGGTFFKPIGNGFGAYGSIAYVFAGRNTFRGPSYGLGIVYNFRLIE